MWYPTSLACPLSRAMWKRLLFEIPQVKEAAVVAIANQPIAFIIAQKERPHRRLVGCLLQTPPPTDLVPASSSSSMTSPVPSWAKSCDVTGEAL